MLISQRDQSLCHIHALNAQTSLDGCHHLPTQCGRTGGRTQSAAAGNEVACQVSAGEQLLADQNALDVRNGHAVTEPIHKGNIAGKLLAFGDQGGEIAGLDLNIVHNILEGIL